MMSGPKVIIRNTPPNFYSLAATAAMTFAKTPPPPRGLILTYENGPTFWVERTKSGNISVSGEKVKLRGDP